MPINLSKLHNIKSLLTVVITNSRYEYDLYCDFRIISFNKNKTTKWY